MRTHKSPTDGIGYEHRWSRPVIVLISILARSIVLPTSNPAFSNPVVSEIWLTTHDLNTTGSSDTTNTTGISATRKLRPTFPDPVSGAGVVSFRGTKFVRYIPYWIQLIIDHLI